MPYAAKPVRKLRNVCAQLMCAGLTELGLYRPERTVTLDGTGVGARAALHRHRALDGAHD